MTTSYQPTSQNTTIEKSWSRLEVAKVLDRIAQSRLQLGALTDIGEEYGIPRCGVTRLEIKDISPHSQRWCMNRR